jgi:SAM-dependent methyltransferase
LEMIKVEYLRQYMEALLSRRFSSQDLLRFCCNICGKFPLSPVSRIADREAPSCYYCGSNFRFRSIAAALSINLFGEIIPITEMKDSGNIRGLGISDSRVYAGPLAKKFSYTNTFYHKHPRLDITNVSDELKEIADFVIASEVLEHVPPPVNRAFENLYSLLKPNGICLFTVPYVNDGKTREHFPDLYKYKLIRIDGKKALENITRDGQKQVFRDLQFHGGRGFTLEMRLFAIDSMLENISNAGFKDITIHRESRPEFGICPENMNSSFTISMRKG